MGVRADSVEATRTKILTAATALFGQTPFEQVSLEDIARRARTTVQTILRRFGSKEQLLVASAAVASRRIAEQRDRAPVGDVRGSVQNLLEHYEEWGDRVLLFLAQEERVPVIRRFTEDKRAHHLRWVERSFAPMLSRLRGRTRVRRAAQLSVVTDVWAWRLLRRELHFSRAETEQAFFESIEALLSLSKGPKG